MFGRPNSGAGAQKICYGVVQLAGTTLDIAFKKEVETTHGEK